MNITSLKGLFLEIFFVVTLLCSPCLGEMDVIFSPDANIQKLLTESIADSSSRIDLAVSNLDSGGLVQALLEARARGVEVRVVVDQRHARSKSSQITFLVEEGFHIKAVRGKAGGRMNNNFAIFDDKLLITGTYDWTERAGRYSHENVVLIDDPSVVELYQNEFDRLYSGGDSLAGKVAKPETPIPRAEPEMVIKVPRGKIPSPSDIPFLEPPADDGEFIDITIEELDLLFGSQSTLGRKEKKQLWENRYRGKYVRWSGVIVYKGITRYDWYKIGLSFDFQGGAEVLVLFRPEYQSQIVQLKEGDVIAYTARLDTRKGLGAPYRLDDGRLLGRLIKKAPKR